MSLNESGFEITSLAFVTVSTVDVTVQVLVTTQQQNIRKLDPNLHCKFRIIYYFVCELKIYKNILKF